MQKKKKKIAFSEQTLSFQVLVNKIHLLMITDSMMLDSSYFDT